MAANGSTDWVGEAMQGVDYNEHDDTPETTAATTPAAATNTAHLANLFKRSPYPPA